jgi:short-subunit dehydrogenase
MKEPIFMKKTQTVLLTGASFGIGYEMAKLFAADHYALVLVARSEEKLAEVAAELNQMGAASTLVIAKDLNQPDAVDEIFKTITAQNISIDVLVNNAGFGDHGSFAETSWEKEAAMIQVNIVALMHLCKLFLPAMLRGQQGRIVNVASIAAFQPGPYMAVYYATKAFVLSFSEALASECAGSGVSVTALCPGPTTSEFQARANIEQTRMVKTGLLKMMDAATVAKIGYRGMLAGKRVVITGMMNKMSAHSTRFVPTRVIMALIKKIHQKE